jgi:hypothetical protein
VCVCVCVCVTCVCRVCVCVCVLRVCVVCVCVCVLRVCVCVCESLKKAVYSAFVEKKNNIRLSAASVFCVNEKGVPVGRVYSVCMFQKRGYE